MPSATVDTGLGAAPDKDRRQRIEICTRPVGTIDESRLPAKVLQMSENDYRIAQLVESLTPAGIARFQPLLDVDVSLERLRRRHFQAAVHERFPLGTVIKVIKPGLAEIIQNRAAGEPGLPGEKHRIVSKLQRLLAKRQVPRFSRAALIAIAQDRPQPQKQETRHSQPR